MTSLTYVLQKDVFRSHRGLVTENATEAVQTMRVESTRMALSSLSAASGPSPASIRLSGPTLGASTGPYRWAITPSARNLGSELDAKLMNHRVSILSGRIAGTAPGVRRLDGQGYLHGSRYGRRRETPTTPISADVADVRGDGRRGDSVRARRDGEHGAIESTHPVSVPSGTPVTNVGLKNET